MRKDIVRLLLFAVLMMGEKMLRIPKILCNFAAL